jgi:CRISPR type III-B/RAMP module RAMP protein Cmr6
MSAPLPAAGPLGALIQATGTHLHGRMANPPAVGVNPLVLLRRIAFVNAARALGHIAAGGVLEWAEERQLGQDGELIRRVNARREAAISAYRDRHGKSTHRRLVARPQWRLAVGLGDRANPLEIGLSLHGTYGWPTIRGSTLKGVTRAWAEAAGIKEADPGQFHSVFGPRQIGGYATIDEGTDASEARTRSLGGTVAFLDAVPMDEPARVTRDVATPHFQPYYRDAREQPGEYHNPTPSEFLVISGGAFAVDLLGKEGHVAEAIFWCQSALDDLGVGGKTSSGYGYMTTEIER